MEPKDIGILRPPFVKSFRVRKKGKKITVICLEKILLNDSELRNGKIIKPYFLIKEGVIHEYTTCFQCTTNK